MALCSCSLVCIRVSIRGGCGGVHRVTDVRRWMSVDTAHGGPDDGVGGSDSRPPRGVGKKAAAAAKHAQRDGDLLQVIEPVFLCLL